MEGKFSLIFILVFFISFSVGYFEVYDDPCSTYTDCSDCVYAVEEADCGWCETEPGIGYCLTGAQNGPEETDNITCIDWNYFSCEKSECISQSNCSSCAGDGCGWCNTICLPGNNTGPYNEDFDCPQWIYDNSTCYPLNCSAFTSCAECTLSEPCGWCNSTSQCENGTETGPNTGSCTNQWAWDVEMCTAIPIDCGVHSNCLACVNDPSTRCGWCFTNFTCEIQDEANCTAWSDATCQPPDACKEGTSCETCSVIPGCGWCNGTVCKQGTETGPSSHDLTCPVWVYDNSKCNLPPTCSSFAICSDCIKNEHCGWCSKDETDGHCVETTKPPQPPGSCSASFWFYDMCPAVHDCVSYSTCLDCTDFNCWWCGDEVEGTCKGNKEWARQCSQNQAVCYSSTSSSSKKDDSSSSGGGGLHGGVIAGIVLSVVFFVLLVGAAGAYLFWKKYWKKNRHYYQTLK